MKVAVFHPGNTESLGGAEAVSYHAASALQEEHDVTHFIDKTYSPQKIEERFEIKNYAEVDTKKLKVPKKVDLLSKTSRFVLLRQVERAHSYAKQYLKIKDDYDKILFSTDSLYFSNISGAISQSDREKIVIYNHGPRTDTSKYNTRSGKYGALLGKYGKIENFRAKKYIFNSNYALKNSIEHGKVIYPPVDSNFEFNRPEKPSLVYAGRIASSKNIQKAAIISEKLDIPLEIIGLAEDEDYIKQLRTSTGDNVKIYTNPSKETFLSKIEQAKYGLNCRGESFGITTIEYMKAGTIPIIKSGKANEETAGTDRLTWNDIEDAVNLINNMENDEEWVYSHINQHSKQFNTSRFRKSIKRIIENEK